MNSSSFRFVLDLHSTQSQVSIPVTKGDTARVWYISFSDGGLPYVIEDGCLAKMEIKRPTGTFLEAFCSIEKNTTVKYDFSQDDVTKYTAAASGVHDCSVTIYDGEGDEISSARFTMVVSDKVVNKDDLNIDDVNKNAIDAMIAAEASRQEAETGRVNAEAARQTNEDARQEALQKFDSAVGRIDEKIAEMDRRAASGEFDGKTILEQYWTKTTIDTSNYKLTVALTDITGKVVHSDSVDLPLASTVVGGSVNDGIVTLILHNGHAIRFSVSELVDGLTTVADVERMISDAITVALNTEV